MTSVVIRRRRPLEMLVDPCLILHSVRTSQCPIIRVGCRHEIDLFLFALSAFTLSGAEPAALIKGTGPGWRAMTEVDFTNVNCKPDTWSWGKDGLIKCTGNPVGVIRTKKMVTT